ncbi:ribosome biogenesis GTPase Der [Candidatus Pantoea edessiphila]|nr:ribosome biogenesis GTPase Der [Candidatus Pantoea edessiphila]
MEPTIALIGRCNVGKSTLFNRLTIHHNDALVSDIPGSTRDRNYGYAKLEGIKFTVIDTGGISSTNICTSVSMETCITSQSLKAIKEADIVLFVVDAITGMTSADKKIAKYLHKHKKFVVVVVNKINGLDINLSIIDFRYLGFENIHAIDSNSGYGFVFFVKYLASLWKDKNNQIKCFCNKSKKLLLSQSSTIVKNNHFVKKANDLLKKPIKLAIIGRPNVGKSTLINSILGEDRVIVHDNPGTTLNSVYVSVKYSNNDYILIDTAGIRKQKNIKETIEKFSINDTLEAINYADVIILLFDSNEDISHQDCHLLSYVINKGKSLVIAMNKWDNLSWKTRKEIREKINLRLKFANFTNIHFISALYNIGIRKLFKSVNEVYRCSTKYVSSSLLTSIMNKAIINHKPPLIRGNMIKMKYAHIVNYNPITILIHGNRLKYLPGTYLRYLITFFRNSMNISGSLIRIKLKEAKNPYKNNHTLSVCFKKYKKISRKPKINY